MEDLCEICYKEKATIKDTYPFYSMLGNTKEFSYCEKCLVKAYEDIEIIKSKFKTKEEFEAMLKEVRESED